MHFPMELATWRSEYSQLTVSQAASCLIVVLLAYRFILMIYRIFHNLFLSPLRKFPGPKIAALTEFWEIFHVIKCDRFYAIQALHEKHGDVVRIGPNQVSIASPRVFHHVFVTKCGSFLKSDFYASIQPGLGPKYAGLFNEIDHSRAMAERRDLQPLFSPANLRLYEDRYDVQLNKLIEVMKQRKEIDLFQYFKFLLLDVIGDLAFNQSFNQLESGEEHQYVIDFNNAFMLIGLQNTFAPIIPLIPYLPFKKLKDAYFGLQRVFAYAQGRVQEFLQVDSAAKKGTLLGCYLDPSTGQPKDGYTPWSMSLAGSGFIIAGSEATSITLTYVFWNLMRYPEVERKVREELSHLPKDYTSAHLANLPYLNSVVKETLRLYPPAPAPMPRVVPEQGFSMETITYPPKTIISVQPYTIHRCAEIFEDPEAFRPERWLDVSGEKKEHMYRAFVPFSAGQRGCIGRGLAWMHLLKGIARILQEFDTFELGENMTNDDMRLIERGALAKPKATKLWVQYEMKGNSGKADVHT